MWISDFFCLFLFCHQNKHLFVLVPHELFEVSLCKATQNLSLAQTYSTGERVCASVAQEASWRGVIQRTLKAEDGPGQAAGVVRCFLAGQGWTARELDKQWSVWFSACGLLG